MTKKNQKVEAQISPELRNIISKMMLARNRENLYELSEYMLQMREKMTFYPMSIDELNEVDAFISKFSILQ